MSTPVVHFQQLPVALFRAFDEQVRGLLREYTLACMGRSRQPFEVDDVARAQAAETAVAEAVARSGAAEGSSADVAYDLDGTDPADFSLLQGVLDHANRLAREGQLLVVPVLPEIAVLRNWLCDQVTAQVLGAAPVAWTPITAGLDDTWLPAATWAGMTDLPDDEAWLVGDDTNRIIGATGAALELLGWVGSELVGQRILVVVPAALREPHVAAFTRAVSTGNYRILDQPLAISAHTRDGSDVPVTLTLTRQAAPGGRTVYLARLAPR
ncbi:MAG: hypothetical protein NVSMB13_12230 [Mycobacteriales bacterium]